MLLFIIITVFFVLSVVAISVNMNTMTESTDRYLFFIMPWTAIAAILIGKYIFRLIKPLYKYYKYLAAILCCVAIIASNFYCPLKYTCEFYTRGKGGMETTVNENSRYIMLVESNWVLTVYPYKLMGCDSFIASMVVNFHNYIDEIKSITPDRDTYVILDTSTLDAYSKIFGDKKDDEGNIVQGNITYKTEDDSFTKNVMTEDEVIETFENEIFPGYKLEFYGSEIIFSRVNHIFRIVPENEYNDIPITDIYIEAKLRAEKKAETE